MKAIYALLFMISMSSANIFAVQKETSEPYISGNTFKAYCDFAFDEKKQFIDPKRVFEGCTIFIKTDYLNTFFSKIHPWINVKYIIVTHNSDYPAPGECEQYLDDEKIIAWFGMNVEGKPHPKLHPIPIGIANKRWPHGNVKLVREKQAATKKVKKEILLYSNFLVATRFQERNEVSQLFSNEPYCLTASPKDFGSYLMDLARSKFVLSPRGNGLDCHRTWESLLMGAYPIVKTSTIDSMYEGLPVVIVNDWKEINEEFLNKKYEEFQSREFNMEKAYFSYWQALINSVKGGM